MLDDRAEQVAAVVERNGHGRTFPALSAARALSVSLPAPGGVHVNFHRPQALAMFAPWSVAGGQLAPPSTLTLTLLDRSPPDHERP